MALADRVYMVSVPGLIALANMAGPGWIALFYLIVPMLEGVVSTEFARSEGYVDATFFGLVRIVL